jgi:CTP:molybdopterin cytidylyltransferase MocA
VVEDRPWPTPAAHVVLGRRWTYAPPPWVMYEAVVEHMDRWLVAQPGEPRPNVAASRQPDAVLLQPWVDPAALAVELLIEPYGRGAAITVLAYADAPQLSDDTRRRVKYRLGKIFGAALRDWVDEPHN